MKLLDARGLSCPEPIIMLRNEMNSSAVAYQIIVDNTAARENVTRYAHHQGYQVEVSEKGGEYTLNITR